MSEQATYPAPATYKGERPKDLIRRIVYVRPYYHAPNGHGLKSARATHTFEARVVEARTEMVVVEYTHYSTHPWKQRQAYYPYELHKDRCICECAACAPLGPGIESERGA